MHFLLHAIVHAKERKRLVEFNKNILNKVHKIITTPNLRKYSSHMKKIQVFSLNNSN